VAFFRFSDKNAAADKIGGQMSLHAPNPVVFIISLILFGLAWIGVVSPIPFINAHPSFLATIAYIVLALGCWL
jgi:hypothetical protein